MNYDGSVLDTIAGIVRKENEPDVDHYAFISDSRDSSGYAGWAPMGQACNNNMGIIYAYLEFAKYIINSDYEYNIPHQRHILRIHHA